VKRWNVAWGISDLPFLIAAGSISDIVDRLNTMPFLVMAAQLCPENMEATFFAMLMSLSNQGTTIAGNLGSQVLTAFKVSRNDVSGLPTAILIRSAVMIGVLIFIPLVPDTSSLNPANVDSLRPTNPYIIKILKFADMYHPEKDEQKEVEQKV
jgi:hypothetical protein